MSIFKTLVFASFFFLGSNITKASQKGQQLDSLKNNFSAALDSAEESRRMIIIKANEAIGKLPQRVSDADIKPIIEALATAATYDPGNGTGQTTYILINRFGKERIVKLIRQTENPSFLIGGITAVENEGKDQ